jgi:hypothetical protein
MVDELAAETVPLNCTFEEMKVAGKPTSADEAAGETVMAGVVVGFIVVRFVEVPVNTLLPTVILEVPVENEPHVGAVPRLRVTPDAETEAIFDHVGAADHRIEESAVFEPTAAPSMDEREIVRLVGVAGL